MLKLYSWNVNGFRAVLNKGFEEFFNEHNPDIIGLQEIKLQEGQVDFNPEGYYSYWNYAQKKDIPEQLYLVKLSQLMYFMELELKNMIMKVE